MEPDELSEALDAARQGDELGVVRLYRAFNPQLLRYLGHHAPDVAEDLASEVWLAAAKGLSTFKGEPVDFRSFLFSVARRRVADHYRSRARRPRQAPFDEISRGGLRGDVGPKDIGDEVVGDLSAQEAIAALTNALSADQAEVVLLRVVAELSVEEVAKIMGRSPGSIRVLQHRALQRLGKLWDKKSVTL